MRSFFYMYVPNYELETCWVCLRLLLVGCCCCCCWRWLGGRWRWRRSVSERTSVCPTYQHELAYV